MAPDAHKGRDGRRELLKAGAYAGLGLTLGSTGLSCCPWCSKQDETTARSATDAPPKDWTMVAYCCLECDKCDAYIATQNNDDVLRAKVAAEWKMAAEQIHCNGCKSGAALFNCEAKKCAIARNLPTCAHCDDFPTCDKDVWMKWPPLKEKVETMRTRLRLSS
ncbi:MAG: DUF3795 domain-containing protein [Phycisphaerales bacterium]|nr:MAG: DUF3795 domain-containing protein [Phycisphaerales bacterium]